MQRKFAIAVAAALLLSPVAASSANAADPAEQIVNGTFDSGTDPWWWTGNSPGSVVDGRLCAPIPAGTTNPWDAIIGQNQIRLQAGESYKLQFDASASVPVTVRANVQLADPPYTQEISEAPQLTPAAQTFSYTFTAAADTTAGQVAFQVGGSAAAYTFCVDNVSLQGGAPPPVYVPDTGPRVRVNQVGYLANGPKQATVVTEATAALPWQLKNAAGTVVASGSTTPRGVDATSGQNVQTADFSQYKTQGKGFTLTADGETSVPFDIGANAAYEQLRTDALSWFYVQRSGIEISDAIAPGYGRKAGHLGVAPNQGDTDVPCQAGVCDYRLDVRGGWYDAGDHGKYVVNGGIAVAQLMSTFERSKVAASGKPGQLADGTLRLPEHGNQVPDVLDEARWELEFLLRMQVPAGQPLAGMVHHKIHDQNWTGLPLDPAADPQPRELHPPSTAATLNLAATAAQGARLFAPYDKAFAAKLLTAAKTAYAAALAHPAIYALGSDSTGGGAYDDADVTDEFYWAAAELYISTGEKTYRDAVTASQWHTADIFKPEGFSWGYTAALGRLDLATVPNGLPDRDRVRKSVVDGAKGYLAAVRANPYGIAYAPGTGKYEWGSNSAVLNNLVVIATAYDLTGSGEFRDGVVSGMDYILGRNALNQSYVTGFGERNSHNQHTRIYGHQLNAALPNPPSGSLAGGPNSYLQDPLAQKLLTGCAPQFCYVDDINSYSTNEIAINWNSTLSWVASFLADQGEGGAPAASGCSVQYSTVINLGGVFIAQATIKNTGRQTLNDVKVRFAYTGTQKVELAVNGTASQTAADVVLTPRDARLKPGEQTTVLLVGTVPWGPNAAPATFRC
ncbi:glycoside hydrolase family 9 protein [Dactylosporangium matsuzakiense]|uniref:Endoglucanase n=1 Tax=Dactylosporangium matsuzakiense TaxID=53360 RepID=A0A9W6KHY1_9ACTN|nr:glycoside hydrolase family 9 protein [Dactylosporangium matsuzakiense]UWZ44467.1 glycoside hydrolase family 9 protein [Dactylosporangium matsuzakiense]GLL01853.1 endoglucanase [Dactylosporangium matsuzakiense]